MQDGEPWWVAKDVCNVLGLTNPTVSLEGLDEDERSKFFLGRQGEANIVSESGVYSLIFRSNKPEAKRFRKWVTGEVLPTLRKSGRYEILNNSNKKFDINHMLAAKMILEEAKITGNQMAIALDNIYKRHTDYSVLAVAGVVLEAEDKQQVLNPTEIGREVGISNQKVNKILMELGYQSKTGDKYEPTKAGDEYAVMYDTAKRHSNGTPICQLKWKTGIIKVLRDYLSGANAAD